MYRPEALASRGSVNAAGGASAGGATVGAAAASAGRGLLSVLSGIGTVFESVLTVGVVLLWGAAAVLFFSQGVIVAGVLSVLYVLYLLSGGRWLIW